jgi:hypothetical protein
MAGKLVGEVIDALEAGITLSDAEFRALIAIAEKCHGDTRQGSVRTARIQAALGRSKRTTERTLARLKKRDLVAVVKRGFKSHGVAYAPIYELGLLAPPKMTEAKCSRHPDDGSTCSRHPDGGSTGDLLPPNPDLLPPNQGFAPAIDPPVTSDDETYDGSYYVTKDDGSIDALFSYVSNGDARAREKNPPPTTLDDTAALFSGLFGQQTPPTTMATGRHEIAAPTTMATGHREITPPTKVIDAETEELEPERDGLIAGNGSLTATTAKIIVIDEQHRQAELARLRDLYPEDFSKTA